MFNTLSWKSQSQQIFKSKETSGKILSFHVPFFAGLSVKSTSEYFKIDSSLIKKCQKYSFQVYNFKVMWRK